ncbi:MAG: hypothetical protein GY822_25825 [Deltaproteobacteria bacterium]|nr:hypothetical protein [Deltaproteobacteria bacterium]
MVFPLLPARLLALRPTLLLALLALAAPFTFGACDGPVAITGCSSDSDCGDGAICFDGQCTETEILDVSSCTFDADCNAGEVCMNGQCASAANVGQGCSSTVSCPMEQYCNQQSNQCQRLLEGWCREDAQCPNAAPICGNQGNSSNAGRCVQCLIAEDCGSGFVCVQGGSGGICEPDGLAPQLDPDVPTDPEPTPDAGNTTSEPDPVPTTCVNGDGACDTGCSPADSDCPVVEPDPVPTTCVDGDGTCDTGCIPADSDCPVNEPDPTPDTCVDGDGTCDAGCLTPDTDCDTGTGDVCADNGWYDDDYCDLFCDQVDPDCYADVCFAYNLYNDSECNPACPAFDPDCVTAAGNDICEDATYDFYGDAFCTAGCLVDPGCGAGVVPYDYCVAADMYNDGICDSMCPSYDGDCGTLGDDFCEDNSFYGDQWCDQGCYEYDADCID